MTAKISPHWVLLIYSLQLLVFRWLCIVWTYVGFRMKCLNTEKQTKIGESCCTKLVASVIHAIWKWCKQQLKSCSYSLARKQNSLPFIFFTPRTFHTARLGMVILIFKILSMALEGIPPVRVALFYYRGWCRKILATVTVVCS